MLYKGVQDDILNMGESGCGFLAVCRYFNQNMEDLPKLVNMAQNSGSLAKDYFVNDWKGLLETVDPKGRRWSAVKSDTWDNSCTFGLARFYCPETKLQHFVWYNGSEILFDSLYNSNTVKKGYIKDYRLFYLKK